MGEQFGVAAVDPLQPFHRPKVSLAEPLELVRGPASQVLVDTPCEEAQLGAVEGSVIVDPAPHDRVDLPGDAGQVLAGSTTEMPGSDLEALGLLRRGRDGRAEAGKIAIWPLGQAAPEGEPKKSKLTCSDRPGWFASLQSTTLVFSG